MIRTTNLVKVYKEVRALDGLDLNVEQGAVYGFLGPNGAGKTTTMRILSGLARADNGQAYLLDKQVHMHNTNVNRSVGVLPEEPAFYTWMSAREYLRDFVAPLYGIAPDLASSRTDEILDILGLINAGDRRIAGFSRGMRQRLGLAQAMIHKPQVLLLDEPVSALDPGGRKDVLNLIESLRGTATILLSTHILADVERVCDTIGIIDKGHMVVEMERKALLARYAVSSIEIEFAQDYGSWVADAKQHAFIEKIVLSNRTVRMLVTDIDIARKELLRNLGDAGLPVTRFEVVQPSLEDIFLRLTNQPYSQ